MLTFVVPHCLFCHFFEVVSFTGGAQPPEGSIPLGIKDTTAIKTSLNCLFSPNVFLKVAYLTFLSLFTCQYPSDISEILQKKCTVMLVTTGTEHFTL